jgi:polyvinyl alcohol dehydrogenase (cytochrome)
MMFSKLLAPLSRGVLRATKARAIACALPALLLAAVPISANAADWPMFGQNLQNTASTAGALKGVGDLQVKWTFTTGGDVSARAAVVGGVAYFPDWAGNLWAVNTRNGTKAWGHQLSHYGLPANTQSRTTPAVVDGVVYLGTQEGAWLLAIDARSGNLLWKTQLESVAPFAIISTAPVVSGGILYTGVASLEEGVAADPSYTCCTARGSVVAVNVAGRNRGQILWKTYTVPTGYSGGGVWGSNLVVDKERGSLYASTGNNYAHPTDPAYQACVAAGGTAAACTRVDNYVDAILALNLNTGAVKWASKFVTWSQQGLGVADGTDDWNVACLVGFLPGQGNCPTNAGPDYDFSSAPNLISYMDSQGRKQTILGAGQKSGIYFAIDPDTGAELWHTQVGPGSSLGGMEWGSASDGKRIYVSIANLYGIPNPPLGSAGSWAALDPATGAILWQVGDPNGAIALGPLAVADGVVYVSSMAGSASAPTMLALSAASGQTLWSFASGASVNAGATIVDGMVFWGSGYTHLGIPGFTGNNKFYAFSKQGK